MSELLLELFSEEIPALMQKNAAEAYKNIFTSLLQENEISAEVQVYIGPRRLTVYIPNLPNIIPLKTVEIRGPKVSAPESAVAGFCRSNNIDKKNLSTLLVQDQLYYILKKQTQPIDIRILLSEIIVKAISKYTWPKSMKWGNYDIDWVRPLRNILCIFDGEVLSMKYGHLIANNLTFGHRFIQPSAIEVNNFADYECKLMQAKVILNQAERKESIVMQLDSIASALNLIIKKDEKLLEEVTGLVELPVVMVGKIPEKFLKLPNEVLTCSMKTHQKYFSTFDKEGNFAPYFLFVSNMLDDQENTIVRGNEKVLSARLSDALYFYQQDLVYSLETRLPKLAQITFHAQLGTIRQKIDRIVSICQFISPKNQNLQIAASLCKSDLTSEMVGEFPELQGIMGHYYAKAEGLNEDIAIAIRDHYKPQGSNDNLPLTEAAIIAIADKLDSLVGLILIGEEPSGSRDPYSLRRQAGGIIRIILGNELKINIKQLVAHTIFLYKFLSREDFENTKSQLILSFLAERAKYYFKDHYNMPLINAIIDFNIEEDLVISKRKIEALQKLLEGENGNNLLTIYKRANNILEGIDREGEINQDAFISNYEQQLFISLKYITKQVDYYIAERDFSAAFGILLEILKPINEFFDNLLVKDSDPIISNNRLLLLQIVKQLFNKLANFDIL